MTDLIVLVSSGDRTVGHVKKVVEGMEWTNVYVITSDQFKNDLKTDVKTQSILIDPRKTISGLSEEIKEALNGKISDLEVAINFVSGDGREHMAVISALMELGLGFRLVALTKEGVKII